MEPAVKMAKMNKCFYCSSEIPKYGTFGIELVNLNGEDVYKPICENCFQREYKRPRGKIYIPFPDTSKDGVVK